jgi:uncharacterized protein YcbX
LITSVSVTELNVYPVKSLAGISLRSATLTPKGLLHDRKFMLVMPNGRFMTQRQFPQMALIKTAIERDNLVLYKQGMGEFVLPMTQEATGFLSTQVWKDDCEVEDLGVDIANWFTKALDLNFQPSFVRMKNSFERLLSNPERYGKGTTTDFADGAPYLVANTSSLDALNEQLQKKRIGAVEMNRFRPNIVIAGLAAFEEHRVSGIMSPAYMLKFCYPCERCIVTTIDQQTAIKDPQMEPFKTLRSLNPMPKKKSPAFAENATFIAPQERQINVGDELTIVFSV